jgi:hypothetical protein
MVHHPILAAGIKAKITAIYQGDRNVVSIGMLPDT